MKKIALFFLLLLSLSTYSQNEGIKFSEDIPLTEAYAKAKAENKLIFIDCFTTWCGPCKMMSRDIFPQKEVADFFNKNFINLKLDMEKPGNLSVAEKYEINAYPSFLFLDSTGNMVHKAIGSMDAAALIELGKAVTDSKNSVQIVAQKIKDGDRSIETLRRYFTLNPYAPENESLVVDYFNTLPDEQKYSEETWNLCNQFVRNPASAPFQFFLNNKAKFEAKFGKKVTDERTKEFFYYTYTNDNSNFESLRNIDTQLFDKTKAEIVRNEAYSTYRKNKNKETWANFIQAATPYYNNYVTEAARLNQIAWMIHETNQKFNDKSILKLGLEWAKKAYKLAPDNDAVIDTYAHLLYDTGNKKTAVLTEQKAVAAAQKAGATDRAEEFKKTVESFKK